MDYPLLTNTPVKEIIFNISFAETVSISMLETFMSTFKDSSYTSISSGFDVKVVEKAGYILKNSEKNRMLSVKTGALSFHKLRDHSPYEDLMTVLNDFWSSFQEICGKLTVTRVAIRYINIIELDGEESISDVVKIGVAHPYKNVQNCLGQVRFDLDDISVGSVVVTKVSSSESSEDSVLLDIGVRREYNNRVFENISEAFEGMREYKNSMFFEALTDKTIHRYE